MSDLFTTIVSSPVARKVGVPQPTTLRRYEAGAPLVDGPVLVTGGGTHAEALAVHLRDVGVSVLTDPTVIGSGTRLGGLVLDLSAAAAPADLAVLREIGAPAVKALARNARVVVIGTAPETTTGIARTVTQRALEGFTRSLGKELRQGATANLVLVRGEEPAPDGVAAAVSFFLSGRSAYVDGQVLRVGPTAGTNPEMSAPLSGKVAVVTGAARGIGADIARVLARDGATVVAVDVPAAGEALARVANEIGGTALQLDITAADAGTRIIEHARGRHGALDIVVHNAGITRDKLFVNMDAAQWDAVIQVNLASVLAMNEVLLGVGGIAEDGRIVCVSSIAGIAGNRGQTNYGASKAGIIGLVDATSAAVEARGITVNAVAPGFIETEMTAKVPFATREVGRRMNSLQQGGRPIDVAETIAWLAQPGSAAVSGQVLRVCGQSLLGA